ncbi:MAG: O-antigen ligase family protein [Rubrivivax sp.]|nr:O-antigen ligase family protein [Rubrivivax sp.]
MSAAAWPALGAALAWSLYLPLGAKYAVWLLAVLAALVSMRDAACRRRLQQQPLLRPLLLLMGWLALSAVWSTAAPPDLAAHLGLYGLWLSVPLLGVVLPMRAARLALLHFSTASAGVALLFVVDHLHRVPPSWLWHSTLFAEGNQRIANSTLLALGAAIAAWQGVQAVDPRRRLLWLLLAVWIALGLALQDRRSGMLLLPLLLLVWSIARQPSAQRRLMLVAIVLAGATLTWQAVDTVNSRFAEGISELRSYESSDRVATSWGQRLRMLELTAQMVREHPWVGQGLASWQGLWLQRTTPGTAVHANSTPHNDYLLLTQQGGVVALALLLAVLVTAFRQALRAGATAVPLLMVWTALALTAMFNAAMRDAKFSLPLLLLAAVGVALIQAPPDAD